MKWLNGIFCLFIKFAVAYDEDYLFIQTLNMFFSTRNQTQDIAHASMSSVTQLHPNS